MTRARAAAGLTAVCLVLGLALPAPGNAAGAAPMRGVPIARCRTGQGTIVAVDFTHWGGPVVRGCALHEPTGYQLLHAAGFTTAGDEHDGPAFICRLGDAAFHHGDQYPTAGEDNCVLTPPASAYWSYWLAPAGSDHWDYSQLGAMSEVPKPGEVELWMFGATNIAGTRGSGVPPFPPARLRASADEPRGGAGGPRLVDAMPTAQHSASGSAIPLVIGICVALALCGAAGWATWRRRRET